MNFKITKEAAKDLQDIWNYTVQVWSAAQADRYFDLLMSEIEYLSKNPYSGRDISEIRKGYFRSNIKSHSIFYRVSQDQKTVEIIRILHQRMDVNDRLNE